jgi:hypothetical protein
MDCTDLKALRCISRFPLPNLPDASFAIVCTLIDTGVCERCGKDLDYLQLCVDCDNILDPENPWSFPAVPWCFYAWRAETLLSKYPHYRGGA